MTNGVARGRRASRARRGLRKLPPELIAQAQDQTAATITRIMLTFVGLALFCLLSLLTPDAALLTGGERLNVPFAGPVSFLGFMIIGPLVLIALRILLQIYIEHWHRLEPIRRRLPARSMPTVAPLQNPLLWGFAAFVLYLLLPLTMLAFTWKAAVLSAWGSGLLCATVAVAASHLMLPLRWPWWSRALLAAGATIFAAAIVYGERPLSRPANLFRADLSNQWLPGSYLRAANLGFANLTGVNLMGAYLGRANIRGADLRSANLTSANLPGAELSCAELAGGFICTNLGGANLRGATLRGANLGGATLRGANLRGANLRAADLAGANLAGADLTGADLEDADIAGANLEGARLVGANLKNASLKGADLEDADLLRAVLERADFEDADLLRAELADANLAGANLESANLEGANLKEANLAGANLIDAERLTQAQLDQACGDEATKLPEGLSSKPCVQ